MDKLDLTQPLEAVNKTTGAVVLVSRYLSPHCKALFVTPTLDSGWYCFELDGLHLCDACPWYIRNADITAKPSTPSNEELTQRMGEEAIDLLCKLAQEKPGGEVWDRSRLFAQWVERAQTFVSDLPKPVDPIDPDLIEAREVAAQAAEQTKNCILAEAYRAGERDDCPFLRGAHSGIKLGRTLAAGGTSHE